MNYPHLDPSQLIEITQVVKDIRFEGIEALDKSDYAPRTKALLLTLAKVITKEEQKYVLEGVDDSELLDPANLLTDLRELVHAVTVMSTEAAMEQGAKVQLIKLRMTLLDRRASMIESMGAVEDAIKFRTLVKSWFENNLPPMQLTQFLTDMETLGV